jgi:EmrB/QacA subfamily drug resistance transporter
MHDTSTAPTRPASFYWTLLIGMQLCVFMCTFDAGVVNLALPVIREKLMLTMGQVKWVAISYTATAALTLPMAAWLGRRFGIRRMFLLGVALFSLASGFCGIAWNLTSLLVLRVIAALGGSLILSLNKVIVLRAFPRAMHGRALGVAGTTFALGILSGLGAGGVLIHLWSWRSIFLISLPIGLLAWPWNAIMTRKAGMPPEEKATPAFDWRGLLWMMGGFGSVVWMINHWLSKPTESILTSLMGTLAGISLIVGWLHHEMNREDSFLHLRILKIKPVGYNFMNGFSVRILMGITNFIIPFYLQDVLNLNPARAGLVLASGAISMGLIGPFAGGMSDRRGMQRTLAIGLGLLTVGVSGFILLPSAIANPEWHIRFITGIVVMQSIIGCGSTFFSASNTNSCLHTVPHHDQPAIAGLLSVNLMAGSALGSTLAGEYFSMIGGVTHVHSETAQNVALVFPPHAFSWLFGACAAWLLMLTLVAWRHPETIAPIASKTGDPA